MNKQKWYNTMILELSTNIFSKNIYKPGILKIIGNYACSWKTS